MLRAVEDKAAGPSLRLQPAEAWPYYDQDEIDAVVSVLKSGKVNQWTGDKVVAFERAYEAYLGGGHAIALANGSLALELILRAFGIGEGDEVIVTPRSFVASAFCVRLVGATPVFADVDRDSGNLTPASVAAAITPRTKAVIPVHLGGWPVEMDGLMALCREHGLKIIEDCAQAQGAEIEGRPVGSFGDAAAFSFCQDKIITTGGEGGLAVFRDEDAYRWAWSFKDHGKNRDKMAQPQATPGFRWVHDGVGTNWRMLESSAAIGLLQLRKLAAWHSLRARNAAIWAEALRKVPGLRLPAPPAGTVHAYYKFYCYLPDLGAETERLRARIMAEAQREDLKVQSGSCSEMYLEEAFADMDVAPLPVAHELGRTSLMFEVHPTLDPDLLRLRAARVAAIIADILPEGRGC